MDLNQRYGALAERVLFYLRGLLGDEHLAEDVLHDVFVTVVHRAGEAPNDAFIFKAARNAALNILSDRQRARRAGEGWKNWKMALAPADPSPEAREEANALLDGLRTLDEDEREIVLLRTHAELTFAEIAVALQIPKSTVAERHAKALAKLKRFLDDPGEMTGVGKAAGEMDA
jgi:RNA polymerase sigma-70 factor (ECF subfamily)